MVMTSSMTSQNDLKVVSLYFIYEWKNNIFHDNWKTNKNIIFKLSAHMYHWIVNMRLQAIFECFVDDVIRSQNKTKLWTTIALSKFELEKRSTAQNVANWTGYQKFKFQSHIQISKFWQVRNLRLPFHFFVFFFHIIHSIGKWELFSMTHIHAVLDIRKNIYRANIQATFELYYHFRCL